jgi:hypothetical protein
MLDLTASEAIVDPREAAEFAGLTYVTDKRPGIRRRGAGQGFRYFDPTGKSIKDQSTLKRIKVHDGSKDFLARQAAQRQASFRNSTVRPGRRETFVRPSTVCCPSRQYAHHLPQMLRSP